MTWTEQAWVEENSPYEAAAYATHLIIAGIVNPDHEYELFVHPDKLAKRCHCSVSTLRRQLAKMVTDGYLAMVDAGGGRGKWATYRFVRKHSQSDYVSQDQNLVTGDVNLPIPRAETYPSGDPVLLVTKEELKRKEIVRDNFPFDALWNIYPKRNGKRLYKPEAERQWAKLNDDDKSAAMVGAKFYREACDRGDFMAKDAYRWIRDHLFIDWQEPAEPRPQNGKPGGGQDTSLLWRDVEGEM